MSTFALYWSATDSSRDIALHVARAFAPDAAEVNATPLDTQGRAFERGDVVVAAVPVFGGRVPPPAAERLRLFTGNGAKVIAMAVYGNRAYEDALAELTDILTERGFAVIAAGACIAQHSMIPEIAAGRPDDVDLAELDNFAAEAAGKLVRGEASVPKVPGNRPYKEWAQNKQKIEVSDACTLCRLCALECPMGAIPKNEPDMIDMARCIMCMRCVHVCPQKARSLPREAYGRILGFLRESAGERREPEWFL